MSLQYEEPQSVTEVNAELEANPSVSQATINAINSLIAPPGATSVVVGAFDGTTITSPAGQSIQMLINNISGSLSDPAFVYSSDLSRILSEIQALIFDSDRSISINLGELLTNAISRSHDATSHHGIDRVISSGNGNDEISVLDSGNTTIDGSDGNDTLILTAGDDSITGNVGNDSVFAGAGDDTIVSGIGIDTVDGGLGFDVVQVAGTASQWAVNSDGEVVVISGAPGSGNAVEAVNIDFISFTGAVGNQFSTVVTYNEDQAVAMRQYQALLDRSADQGGAEYWLNAVNNGFSDVGVADAFIGSQEYIAKYGTQTNTEFVQQLYENALNRSAEQAGLDFWVSALDRGASRGQVSVAITETPEGAEKIANVVLVNGLV